MCTVGTHKNGDYHLHKNNIYVRSGCHLKRPLIFEISVVLQNVCFNKLNGFCLSKSLSCLHITFCNIEDAFSLIDSKFGNYVDASISSEMPWI
jgi:hypothetical protein